MSIGGKLAGAQVCLPSVILPLMIVGSLRRSAMAASGMPQFATGPQKCVLQRAARIGSIATGERAFWD